MTFQICSDLHLEFDLNNRFIHRNPITPKGDILLLAGDIMPFTTMNRHEDFFDFVSSNFEVTYWIPGNHEYYHSDIAHTWDPLNEKIRSNVLLVNNQSVVHGNTKLILSTLWSSISTDNAPKIARRMNDFQVIRNKGKIFTPADATQLHEKCKAFITSALAKKETERTVIATHHLPTFLSYPEQYVGDLLNEGFATELCNFIESSHVDYWIFGHHHHNTPEFSIGRTKLITNQLGYVHRNEHLKFRSDYVIEIH
jgi:predicted phosphohydrolase